MKIRNFSFNIENFTLALIVPGGIIHKPRRSRDDIDPNNMITELIGCLIARGVLFKWSISHYGSPNCFTPIAELPNRWFVRKDSSAHLLLCDYLSNVHFLFLWNITLKYYYVKMELTAWAQYEVLWWRLWLKQTYVMFENVVLRKKHYWGIKFYKLNPILFVTKLTCY